MAKTQTACNFLGGNAVTLCFLQDLAEPLLLAPVPDWSASPAGAGS